MKKFENFYETIDEARMRLDQTVVLYDGEPHHILCVTNHREDGVFRAYLDPVTDEEVYHRRVSVPYDWYDEPGMSRGKVMDKFIEDNEGCPVKRKMLNSPKFNRFQPFPLGMINSNGRATYLERSPARHTQQGLTGSMIHTVHVDMTAAKGGPRNASVYNKGIRSCILGLHPDPDQCLTGLTDKGVSNTSVAFHRYFAFVKGPLNLLFLAYKGDIVGFLPDKNLSAVKVCDEHSYVREVIDELAIFNRIN